MNDVVHVYMSPHVVVDDTMGTILSQDEHKEDEVIGQVLDEIKLLK